MKKSFFNPNVNYNKYSDPVKSTKTFIVNDLGGFVHTNVIIYKFR